MTAAGRDAPCCWPRAAAAPVSASGRRCSGRGREAKHERARGPPCARTRADTWTTAAGGRGGRGDGHPPSRGMLVSLFFFLRRRSRHCFVMPHRDTMVVVVGYDTGDDDVSSSGGNMLVQIQMARVSAVTTSARSGVPRGVARRGGRNGVTHHCGGGQCAGDSWTRWWIA